MRILKVTQSYHPFLDRGGPAVKVRALARGLAARGHRVTVLTADLGGGRCHDLGEKTEWGWRSVQDDVEAVYLRTAFTFRALTVNPHLRLFCRERLGEFDVVHIYGLYDLIGPIVARHAVRFNVPFLLEPLGMSRPIDRAFFLKDVWLRLFGNRMTRNAWRIVATSEMERVELIEDGIPADRVLLRYNPVDLAEYETLPPRGTFRTRWKISAGEPLILFLSRLIPRKGADLLIESFSDAFPNAGSLVIAGPEGVSGYLDRLRAIAVQCHVGERVRFTGPLYGEEKKAALADADIFALPSSYENFANAPVEAMASGVPVIVTERCGIGSSVAGRAGFVVSRQRDAFAGALRRLVEDRGLRKQFQDGCKEVASQYSAERVAVLQEQIYQQAVSARQSWSAPRRTFYDHHPFDWTELYSQEELDHLLGALLKKAIEGLADGALVLDIGCGPGRVMKSIANRGRRAIGLDRSMVSIQAMVRRTGRPGVVADNLRLPLPDDIADLVISDGVIHHIPDPQAAFAENTRVLRPGGRMYLAVYRPKGRYELLYRGPGRLIRLGIKRQPTRALVYALALFPYGLVHFVRSRGKRTWDGIRNLFYDYFVTPEVHFLPRAEIERWCREHGLDVIEYTKERHVNVHRFLLEKKGREHEVDLEDLGPEIGG